MTKKEQALREHGIAQIHAAKMLELRMKNSEYADLIKQRDELEFVLSKVNKTLRDLSWTLLESYRKENPDSITSSLSDDLTEEEQNEIYSASLCTDIVKQWPELFTDEERAFHKSVKEIDNGR